MIKEMRSSWISQELLWTDKIVVSRQNLFKTKSYDYLLRKLCYNRKVSKRIVFSVQSSLKKGIHHEHE